MIDRTELKKERNLSDEELGRVIERAAALQRAAVDDRAAAIDVAAVAGELDIEERHVASALAELEADRKRAAAAAQRRAARARVVRASVLAGGVALALVIGLGARARGQAIADTSRGLATAAGRLEAALARQANLIPQLVALSGGDARTLLESARDVIQADGPRDKLSAATRFQTSITAALAAVPKAGNDSALLNLQHEAAGAQNRIATERARYEAAWARNEEARTGALARLALILGMD